jgi:hypothetical protein
MLRRVTLAAVVGIACAVPIGCRTRTCPGDSPLIRQDQLSEKSEEPRLGEGVWRMGGGWFKDQPDPALPQRIHGDIL